MSDFWKSAGGAAAISSVGSGASGLFGGLFSAGQQRRQYKYNLRLQKQQQQWQKEMWDLENMYNLPINEVKRLLDAGINPALAFSNGGAAAAPIPQSGSAGGVSAPTAEMPNVGAAAVQAMQQSALVDSQTELNKSLAGKADKEGDAALAAAGKADSEKKLNEVEYEIKSDPDYIKAMSESPGLRNDLARLDKLMGDLSYSYDLETYGTRVEGAKVGLEQQKLTYITGVAQLRNIDRTYEYMGAKIRYLDAGTAEQRAQAAVLRQDLDIRAGKALLGTLERDALQYCVDHGVNDSVSGEIRSFVSAMADEYSSGVLDGVYSSRASARTAYEETVYQKKHGQDRRELEQTEIERRGNYYRTSQWNMSINTALNALNTAVDVGSTVMTRGMNKAAGSLVTPKAGSERMPLSPEAMDVIRKIAPEVEKKLRLF